MNKEDIQELLDTYGLERLLEDNQYSLVDLLEILECLGYIELSMYMDSN